MRFFTFLIVLGGLFFSPLEAFDLEEFMEQNKIGQEYVVKESGKNADQLRGIIETKPGLFVLFVSSAPKVNAPMVVSDRRRALPFPEGGNEVCQLVRELAEKNTLWFLQMLTIDSSAINDEGMETLAKAFSHLPNLQSLVLFGNRYSSMTHLVQAIRSGALARLECLNLSPSGGNSGRSSVMGDQFQVLIDLRREGHLTNLKTLVGRFDHFESQLRQGLPGVDLIS